MRGGLGGDFLGRNAGGELDQLEGAGMIPAMEDAQVGDDHVDHASPFRLIELAPGVSAEEVAAKTTAHYER